jgi:hypothetical protein
MLVDQMCSLLTQYSLVVPDVQLLHEQIYVV